MIEQIEKPNKVKIIQKLENDEELCDSTISRLYSVKPTMFQNAFFWYFFIKNDLSRVDLIIKMVLEFLSNL